LLFNLSLQLMFVQLPLWARLTKIYPPLPTSVQPISITKTLLIVPTKNERDPPLFTGKLLIKIQNILRNTTQVSWTDVGSGGYILVSRAHSNTSFKSYFNGLEFDIGPFMKIREIIFLNI
jgi:hypothetical protein